MPSSLESLSMLPRQISFTSSDKENELNHRPKVHRELRWVIEVPTFDGDEIYQWNICTICLEFMTLPLKEIQIKLSSSLSISPSHSGVNENRSINGHTNQMNFSWRSKNGFEFRIVSFAEPFPEIVSYELIVDGHSFFDLPRHFLEHSKLKEKQFRMEKNCNPPWISGALSTFLKDTDNPKTIFFQTIIRDFLQDSRHSVFDDRAIVSEAIALAFTKGKDLPASECIDPLTIEANTLLSAYSFIQNIRAEGKIDSSLSMRISFVQEQIMCMVNRVRQKILSPENASRVIHSVEKVVGLPLPSTVSLKTIAIFDLKPTTSVSDIIDAAEAYGVVEAAGIASLNTGFGFCRFVKDLSVLEIVKKPLHVKNTQVFVMPVTNMLENSPIWFDDLVKSLSPITPDHTSSPRARKRVFLARMFSDFIIPINKSFLALKRFFKPYAAFQESMYIPMITYHSVLPEMRNGAITETKDVLSSSKLHLRKDKMQKKLDLEERRDIKLEKMRICVQTLVIGCKGMLNVALAKAFTELTEEINEQIKREFESHHGIEKEARIMNNISQVLTLTPRIGSKDRKDLMQNVLNRMASLVRNRVIRHSVASRVILFTAELLRLEYFYDAPAIAIAVRAMPPTSNEHHLLRSFQCFGNIADVAVIKEDGFGLLRFKSPVPLREIKAKLVGYKLKIQGSRVKPVIIRTIGD